MGKQLRKIMIGTCVFAMGLILVGCSTSGSAQSAPTDVLLGNTNVKPTTYLVRKGTISNQIQESGAVQSVKQQDLYFTFDGTVAAINTDVGKLVKAGDPLVVLKDDGIANKIQQQKFNVERAQIKLAQLQNTSSSDPYDIAAAKLDLKQQTMSLDQLNQHQDELTLRAPLGGVISRVQSDPNNAQSTLNVGDYLQAYNAFITIAAPGQSQVVCTKISRTDAQYIAPGQDVSIADQSDNGSYDGTVASAPIEVPSSDPANSPTTYNVYINVDKLPAGMLGQSVSVTIKTQTRLNALLVPASALHQGIEGPYVELWKNGRREQTLVQVGVQNGTDAQILSGLTSGEDVVMGN